MQTLHALVLTQYDRIIGLDWTMWRSMAVSPKPRAAARSPGAARGSGQTGPETLGPGRRDRRAAAAGCRGANRHDRPLLGPTLAGLEAWTRPGGRPPCIWTAATTAA